MTTPTNSFGPWTTSLGDASRVELSAFWSHRMSTLASLASTPQATRRNTLLIGATAAALAGTPLIDFRPTAAVAQQPLSAATQMDQLATRATPPTEAERAALDAMRQRAHALEQELAKSHGYRLEPGELVKFIPVEQGGDVRRELVKLHAGDRPAMLRFHILGGELSNTGANYDEIKLAELIDVVAGIKTHRIECDAALLDRVMTGDIIFAGEYSPDDDPPTKKFEIDEALIGSLEKTLSAATKRPLSLEVRTVERPVLVAHGDYRFTAIADEKGKVHQISGPGAEQSDGIFQFPARRGETGGSVGVFNEFLEDVGELLLIPIVDEIATHPTKRSYFWGFPNKPVVEGQKPLDAATADAVIAALAKQTGLTFTKETRPVQMLFIERSEVQP